MKKSLVPFFVLLGAALAFAAPGISFSVNGIRTNGDLIAGFPVPLPSGADLGLEIPIGSMSSLTIRAAGGYESRMILRSAVDASPIAEPAGIDGTNRFFWINALGEIGFRQYLHKPADQWDAGPAWLFGIARLRWEQNSDIFPTTLFPDAQKMFSASALAGIAYDSVEWVEIRMKKGLSSELSVEYSPAFANFAGAATEYMRINLTSKAYIPLRYIPSYRVGTGLAPSLALYATGDWALGSHIPHEILTTFGGSVGTKGIGDMVRGTQGWGYEAARKAYAGAEFRIAGPSFFRDAPIYPAVYAFAEGAWYDALAGSPLAQNYGLLASAGGGAAISVYNFLWVGAYAGWRFAISDPLAAIYFSGSPSGFFWSFSFIAHF